MEVGLPTESKVRLEGSEHGLEQIQQGVDTSSNCRREQPDQTYSPKLGRFVTGEATDQTELQQELSGAALADVAYSLPVRPTWTTVVVGNIHHGYKLEEVVAELLDLKLNITFVYLQTGRSSNKNRGYCFVNFSSHQHALDGWGALLSHTWEKYRYQKHKHSHRAPGPDLPWQFSNTTMAATTDLDGIPRTSSVRWAEIQGHDENLRLRVQSLQHKPGVSRNVWCLGMQGWLTLDDVRRCRSIAWR